MKTGKTLRSQGGSQLQGEARLVQLQLMFRKQKRKIREQKSQQKRLLKVRKFKQKKYGSRPTNLRSLDRRQYTHQQVILRPDGLAVVLPRPKQLSAINRMSLPSPLKRAASRDPPSTTRAKRTLPVKPRGQLRGGRQKAVAEARQIDYTKALKRAGMPQEEDLEEIYEKIYGELREKGPVSLYSRKAFDDRYAALIGEREGGSVKLEKMKLKHVYLWKPEWALDYLSRVERALVGGEHVL